MQSADTLRTTLRDLEATADQAGAKLINAEADHRSALRRSVEQNDFTLSIATEAALTEARVSHDRARTSVAVAGQLLTEAVKREKQETQAAVREALEQELADMAETARSLDTKVAELVGALLRLKEREFALHRQAKDAFRSPWAAPRILSTATRPLSVFLATTANGNTPDVEGWIAKAVAIGADNIRDAFDASA